MVGSQAEKGLTIAGLRWKDHGRIPGGEGANHSWPKEVLPFDVVVAL